RACVRLSGLLPAEITGLPIDSKAQCEQVRALSVQRLGSVLGQLPAAVMSEIEDALRLHLGL
ncbi:MAG TPA: type II toxin-antitoxin system PemK/MazF family toxin, partial [Solirubrobacteraceae bacterium]